MAYAFSQDMPGGTKDFYRKLSDGIGDEMPKGLIVHLAFETQSGTRLVDLWETEADFNAFRVQRLGPAMEELLQTVGITRESLGEPHWQELQPIEIFGKDISKRAFP